MFRKNKKTIDIKAISPNLDNRNKNVNFHHLIEREYTELLMKAKETAKKAGYKFVWFKNASILVRKDESSSVIQINSHKDLSKIK